MTEAPKRIWMEVETFNVTDNKFDSTDQDVEYILRTEAWPEELVERLRKEWKSWEGTVCESEGYWLRDLLAHITESP